ncbi:hypothetical protein [Novosphingobium profundi]|uniref:hypothetical protein n=1 Tax=Novosphingobium profundi TaxID=1774954 RepID=UPI001CFE6684|nr:hypothetical protein [Novosphingobium profundi]
MNRAALSRRLAPAILCLAASLALAAPLSSAGADSPEPPPVPGGKIGTLKMGRYACELPGDAGGLIGEPVPEYDFTIVNASSYLAKGVRGSYLHTGSEVVMTGGVFRNRRFTRISAGFLEETGPGPEPEAGAMRCILVPRR